MTSPLRFLAALPFLLSGLCMRLEAEPVIAEFAAANETGLADEDGDRGDWLEIFNPAGTVSLEGWHLTDAKDERAKWTFPAVTMGPGQVLVVFASGKNRAVPGQPLHTSFRLSSAGGYLALTRPDRSVVTEFDPYPAQYRDRSYGTAQTVVRTDYVTATAPVKWKVPADDSLERTWTQTAFNDAAWSSGPGGLGYEPVLPGFRVKAVQAAVPVTSVTDAETVLATPAQQLSVDEANRPVIDLWNTGATGHYGGNVQPPGMTGADVDDFVIECTGTVTIPAAGARTFGVSSNDGFRLTIGSFTFSQPATTSAAVDTFATFNFPAAGAYPLRLVFFSHTGGGELELFSVPGTYTSFNAAAFDLAGDTASGGLAASAPVVSANPFTPYIRTEVKTALSGVSSSLYARYPFSVANPAAITSLTLPLRYDDGCAVYVNGTEVLRRNAPAGTLTNVSSAPAARSNAAAVSPEIIDLTAHTGLLTAGQNVLAIHGLNVAAGDEDFLLQPELAEITVTAGAVQYFTTATPGTYNTTPAYNRVAPITASHAHGFFAAPISLSLTTATPGAVIRYTYDGSTPAAASALYTGPVKINKTTTLRAVAMKPGSDDSAVLTQTYLFPGDVIHQGAAPPVIVNPPGSPAAVTTWPESPVGGQRLDYGMDPGIVNAAPWNATITADLQSLPVISLVTDLPNLFDATTGVYVNAYNSGDAWERPCSMELIHPDGTKSGFQQDCGLRIRGNFSRDGNNPKHSLRLFFRDTYGSGKLRYPFFGADGPAEHDVIDLRTSQDYSWAYLGSTDAHFIGDIFARDLMGQLGLPTTRGAYYHVYLNGQYWGMYDSEERINPSFCVTHLGGTEADWDIIKTNEFHIEAAAGSDADYQLLWQKTESPAIATVAGYMEAQGLNPDGTRNPAYKPLLDPVAITDYMLMNFVIGNGDGPTYIDGNLVNNYFAVRSRTANLPWVYLAHDSEVSFRYLDEDLSGIYGLGADYPAANPRRFMERCLENPEYRMLFADRVQKHFFNGGVLTPPRLTATYLARKNEIDRAIVGESARWGDSARLPALTREDDWLPRVTYLLDTWMAERPGIVVNQLRSREYIPALAAPLFAPQRGGTLPFGTALSLQNPNPGGVIYFTTDGSDPRAIGGAVNGSAISYSSPVVLSSSILLRARIKDGATWSALDEARFFPAQDLGLLRLTEIHYNPLPNGTTGADDLEFVELKNAGATPLDLGGCAFTAGIAMTFPQGFQIPGGGFAVLAKNPAAFAVRYPGVVVAGTYTGKLDNGGEQLVLSDSSGAKVLDVTYDDDLPWPLAADGYGFSLVPGPGQTGWRASRDAHGSPGADDPAPQIPELRISELLPAHNPPIATAAVEIYNPGTTAVDYSGWWLSNDPATPRKFRIPPGSVIQPGGVGEWFEADFNPPGGSGFTFAPTGGSCVLMSADAAGNLTGYSHGFSYQAAAGPDGGFMLYVNSAGEESFPISRPVFIGSPPRSDLPPVIGPVVLNEIHYHPAPGEDEFVEIHNIGADPVPLYLAGDPAVTWRIGGINFPFPPGTVLAAGAYAVVTPTDPAAFRAKYNVPPETAVYGPWSGTLQDSGERLSLEQPYSGPAGSPPVIPWIVRDSLRYNDKAPWPPAADGSGPSLQRLPGLRYADEPLHWVANGLTPGRPNAQNFPPFVVLTSPSDGTTHTLPAAVTLSATATDPGGFVRRVEFYADGIRIGEALQPPWSLQWSTATVGLHTVWARGFDEAGGSADSTTASLTVNAAPGPVTQTPLAFRSAWKYRDTGVHPGPAWNTLTYNDSAWPSGGAPLGYGDGDEVTVVADNATPGYNAADGDRYITTWFRRKFSVPAAAVVSELRLRFVRDDGIVIYINGTEVWRDNMGEGPVTDETTAVDTITGAAESQAVSVTLPAAALQSLTDGENVIAVEIHQSAPDSSDISFDLELTASLLPQLPVLVSGPERVGTFPGSGASFSVTATGPGLQYQWRKGSSIIPGATAPTFSIASVTPADAGLYSCVVSNYAGTVISPGAQLFLHALPTLQASLAGGELVVLSFPAIDELTYEVLGSTDLVNWAVLASYSNRSGTVTWAHSVPGAGRWFYKLRASN